MGAMLLPAVGLALLSLPGPGLGQEPARVELESISGEVTERPLAGFRTADPRDEGAVFVRFRGLEEPAPPPGPADERAVVRLHTGDRLSGRAGSVDGDRLELAIQGRARIALAIEEVASLVIPARIPRDGSVVPEAPEEGDRLYLARGRGLDKLDGLVAGFEAEGIAFEGRFGRRVYGWDEVAALFIEDLDEGERDTPAVPVVVELDGGGRLSGALVAVDADGVRIATRGNANLLLPAIAVSELVVDDGSVRFLSDLPLDDRGPTDLFGGSDDLGMRYAPQMDRNFRGDPLVVGGRRYARGIGVHAPSRLRWALDGGWRELRALAAVDDSALENEFPGSVVFRILVDGELRWESAILRGGDLPQAVPTVSLAGAEELVLEVDPATEAFVSDRADWLRPVLVRGRE